MPSQRVVLCRRSQVLNQLVIVQFRKRVRQMGAQVKWESARKTVANRDGIDLRSKSNAELARARRQHLLLSKRIELRANEKS